MNNLLVQESEYKYVLVPLPMLREVFIQPNKAIRDMFYVGIYRTASSQSADSVNAIKQVLYCFYRDKESLTRYISAKLDQLVEDGILDVDEDYNGFNGDVFEPEQEIECLADYINTDSDFYEKILEFHRLRQIRDIISINFDVQLAINTFNSYSAKYNNFQGCPLMSFKTSMLLGYLKEGREIQLTTFAMYAGIRSVIGNKDYAQTTRAMITNRMFGAKNDSELKEVLKDKNIKKAYDKYSKRYWMDLLMTNLLTGNFLSSKIGINRRTYVSCKLDYMGLSQKVIEKNISVKKKQIKDKEAEAKKYILQHLNK